MPFEIPYILNYFVDSILHCVIPFASFSYGLHCLIFKCTLTEVFFIIIFSELTDSYVFLFLFSTYMIRKELNCSLLQQWHAMVYHIVSLGHISHKQKHLCELTSLVLDKQIGDVMNLYYRLYAFREEKPA